MLSAGIASDADTRLDDEHVRWADRIFVMEKRQRSVLHERHRDALHDTPVVSLDIPDRYRFMDPELVALLESKMARFIA